MRGLAIVLSCLSVSTSAWAQVGPENLPGANAALRLPRAREPRPLPVLYAPTPQTLALGRRLAAVDVAMDLDWLGALYEQEVAYDEHIDQRHGEMTVLPVSPRVRAAVAEAHGKLAAPVIDEIATLYAQTYPMEALEALVRFREDPAFKTILAHQKPLADVVDWRLRAVRGGLTREADLVLCAQKPGSVVCEAAEARASQEKLLRSIDSGETLPLGR
jgi:hypothetical protein